MASWTSNGGASRAADPGSHAARASRAAATSTGEAGQRRGQDQAPDLDGVGRFVLRGCRDLFQRGMTPALARAGCAPRTSAPAPWQLGGAGCRQECSGKSLGSPEVPSVQRDVGQRDPGG